MTEDSARTQFMNVCVCVHAGIKPASPALADGFFTTEPPGKPPMTNSIPIFHTGKLVDPDF